MTLRLFITGTDTHIGKTYASVALLKLFQQHYGLSTIAKKPVASGCTQQAGKLYNDDALALQKAASIFLPYIEINPFPYLLPIAPHLAANNQLSVKKIAATLQLSPEYHPDIFLIEGIGGLLVPLNQQETLADLIIQENLLTILIVGIKLGCLNHALLTQAVLQEKHIRVGGWIANCIDPHMLYAEKNIQTLKEYLDIPFLGKIAHGGKIIANKEIQHLLFHNTGIAR